MNYQYFYKHAKDAIKDLADTLHNSDNYKTDKAAIREFLNNQLDSFARAMNLEILRENISERRGTQVMGWLTGYVIKRHKR